MSRTTDRKNTKFFVCPTCAVSRAGWSVWGYHGKGSGIRQLLQHRIRAHSYQPRPSEEKHLRRYVK